jgi:hypothetical protein
MGGRGEKVLDTITDLAAVGSLTYLAAVSSEPLGAEVVGAITTVAIGQRYAKYKWLDRGEPKQ